MNPEFFLNSILLGTGLAMDAFSVSCVNALVEPGMKGGRMGCIAGVYAGFQFLMPLIGWVLVHTVRERFTAVRGWIPWIALVLLVWIGGKMLLEGIRARKDQNGHVQEAGALTVRVLLVQGIATSIDALSVGFTISEYNLVMALSSCLVIGIVTFLICTGGLWIGKIAGMELNGRANIFGGLILIAIGLKIALTSLFYT